MLEGPVPNVLQNMTALRELDLTSNSFNSTVPLWLGNSKNLVHLILVGNQFNNIEGGLSSILNKSCSLKSLDLADNNFQGDQVLGSNENSSRCLSYNLESLNLEYNNIGGRIPDWFGQLKGLKYLSLSTNLFDGSIPSSLGQLSLLRRLELSDNQLSGTIPQSLERLSSLEDLYLSYNQLNGTIPQNLGKLSTLGDLDLSNNQLKGHIPQTLGIVSTLRYLDLSHNQLSGSIPENFGQLVNLSKLDISSNSLEGIISELHFANLTSLTDLNIGSNRLTLKVKFDWIPPFSLSTLNMSSCRIGSQFPQWLQTQEEISQLDLSNTNIFGGFPRFFGMKLSHLDLSNNKINGSLPVDIADTVLVIKNLHLGNNQINGSMPNSLCKLESLEIINLSRNKLTGKVPNCWRAKSLNVIDLSFNNLSGIIPNSIGLLGNLEWLQMNENRLVGEIPQALRSCTSLKLLDLGENKISGNIPQWIGENLLSLRILRLRSNMFNGNISSRLCRLCQLQILDLSLNNLLGEIPRCFNNLIGMTMGNEDPGSGIPTKKTPDRFKGGQQLEEKAFLFIKGQYREYTKTLRLLHSMDLSRNKLNGSIPEELTTLSGLRNLNLSHNHLSGNIPNKIGGLKSIESLDLSDNQLFGAIPQSLSTLTSLNHLNLSYNNLSGKIPSGNQLQTLNDPSFYAGNPQLCGAPLRNKCPNDSLLQPPMNPSHDNKDEKSERILFYFVIFSGYATGFWVVIGTLIFKREWRHAYFRFADDTKEWILTTVAVKVARVKKMIKRTCNNE